MRLLVVSHKECWRSASSRAGYATDGGFPFQLQALSELFDETRLVVPCRKRKSALGENALNGHNLAVVPLGTRSRSGLWRKVSFLTWLAGSGWTLLREVHRADAVHAPIPGDVGTIGMLLAYVLRKPMFVRHCGNWLVQRTLAEYFWKWFMEKHAGGRNVMLATGGDSGRPPSARNRNVRWIFATSLTKEELKALAPPNDPPAQPFRLIIVCRQEAEKGTRELIESLPLLLQDFPDVTLDVVGDGGALAEFKSLAVALNLHNKVFFHGKVDHARVMQLLRGARVFCYPTRASEGFPKVVLEALACGLPVVTTRVSVLPDLIGRGCGVLLDDTKPASVARAICEVVSNAEAYTSMSQQSVLTAQQYSLEEWRDTIGNILKSAWETPLSSSPLPSSSSRLTCSTRPS